jgi:antitoxin HigA-1
VKIFNTHPGEVLREEFLVPLGINGNQLALALRVPSGRVVEILNEKRGISVDTALRLSRYFGTKPEYWLNLQQAYELALARETLAKEIKIAVLPRAA